MSELFDAPVRVLKLLDKIYFTEENVKAANLENPTLQLKAARYYVQCKRERLEFELTLKNRRARRAIKLRRILKRKYGKVPTEATIRERLDADIKFIKLERQLNRFISREDYARQVFDVFKSRQSAIKVTADLRRQETAWRLIDADKDIQREKLKSARKVLSDRHQQLMKDEDDDD